MNTKKHKIYRKRLTCFLLFLAVLINFAALYATPVLSADIDTDAVATAPATPYIALEGERLDELLLSNGEKITVSAVYETDQTLQYSWQIRHSTSTDRWIPIAKETEPTLAISHALIDSLADQSGNAYIRCVMKGEGEYITNTLTVRAAGDAAVMRAAPYAQSKAATNEAVATADDTGDSYTTHSIVINYLFDNNAIAFEPYGATVAHGSSFKETVSSPEVVGYAPFRRIGEDYVEAPSVVFDLESVTEDITINIIYEPALVNFSIHHHLQNLHNDDYSLSYDYITTGRALTGSVVPSDLAFTEAQLPGFKALSYEKLTVAADGSTVIEIRYDRMYYLVDFDMSGGYGTEPVYTRYGDTVGANTPIRHGYVFDGWELVSYDGHLPTADQQAELALTPGSTIIVPAANLQYRARWITTQTTYTMVFWQENADDDGYTYWGHLEDLGALSGSLVSGRDIISQVADIDDEQYFTFNEGKTDKNVLVEGDGSTIVNVYYTRNYYKLTIKATGLCTIPVNHVHDSECYDQLCSLSHTHTDACVPTLACQIPEHTEHTDACLICTIDPHTHSPACSCLLREHTHSKDCWPGVGKRQYNRPTGAPTTAEDGYVFRNPTRYIYIKDAWYRYNGMAAAGTIVDKNCGYTEEHTHSDDCACKIPEHTHGNGCYRDEFHTHGDSCYTYSCGQVEHQHAEGCLRLKCGITENHSHSSTCRNSGGTNVVKEIYRKYGQSIKDIWPIVDDNGVSYADGERWKPSDSSYYTNVLVYITQMTPDSFTLTLNKASHVPYTMKYYLELLEGEEAPAGVEVVTYKNKRYALDTTIKAKYNYVTKAEDFFDIKGFVQYKSSPGFSGNQISISGNESARQVKFYYNRITDHYLQFSNYGNTIDNKTQYGIPFGASLTSYNFQPDYPSNLEPGAFTFAGWYTSPGCFDGTEVNWDTLTMPEGDLLLYAKWEPIKHKVNVWLDSSLSVQIGKGQIVDHGAFATAPADHITNGNYVFQGWFYQTVVNGETVEKAFNFSGIPVLDDMDIYAKWGSHVSVDYRVNYVLYETGEPIADPTVGSAIAGHNKTFEAKAGDDLYAAYRVGFYPLVNSHTITMSVDGNHEFTFYYVYVPSMPYAVRYVNAETGAEILPTKLVMDNELSVVTETFTRVDKMMPDAYQKRLVLSANSTDSDGDGVYDDNVITFYYNFDEVHAYYKVVHYIQNINTNGYREYRSIEAVGTVGEAYSIESLSLTGFYFNGARTTVNGVSAPTSTASVSAVLTDEGMLIEMYYDRLSYNYTVIYTDGSTGEHIHPTKSGTALFGAQLTEFAVDLKNKGYTLSSDSVKVLNISANETHNVIEFVYLESVVSIKYHIIGMNGCGTLSRSSENIKAATGVPLGSTPIVSNGFLFVGWFADANCTVAVDPSMIDPNTLKLVPSKGSSAIWADGIEFFAKFIPKETKLTVITTGCDPRDSDQSFIFRLIGVDGTETAGIDLVFTISGNSAAVIAGLPIGDYTVILTDWSWRYDVDQREKSITLTIDPTNNQLIFTVIRTVDSWLDGNTSSKNIFS